MTGLQENCLEARLRQPGMQPLRQGASLDADPLHYEHWTMTQTFSVVRVVVSGKSSEERLPQHSGKCIPTTLAGAPVYEERGANDILSLRPRRIRESEPRKQRRRTSDLLQHNQLIEPTEKSAMRGGEAHRHRSKKTLDRPLPEGEREGLQ